MIYDLKELFKGIDGCPFSGEKDIIPTVVVCNGKGFSDSCFSSSVFLLLVCWVILETNIIKD